MAMTSSSRHNNNRNNQQRSLSPSGRFCSSSISSSSSFTSSSASLFSRHSSNGYNQSTSSPSIRFSIENRTTSPNRSISVNRRHIFAGAVSSKKKTCTCSPTSHPGSFRCNFHRNLDAKRQNHHHHSQSVSYSPNRLNMRRSAMKNSLVRIGSVEGGEMVKRALATLIRPSSHQQKRRCDFQPRPSRLSSMTFATVEDNQR